MQCKNKKTTLVWPANPAVRGRRLQNHPFADRRYSGLRADMVGKIRRYSMPHPVTQHDHIVQSPCWMAHDLPSWPCPMCLNSAKDRRHQSTYGNKRLRVFCFRRWAGNCYTTYTSAGLMETMLPMAPQPEGVARGVARGVAKGITNHQASPKWLIDLCWRRHWLEVAP